MRIALLALILLASTACHGAAWDNAEFPTPPRPPPGVLAQYCTYDGANDLGVVNAFLAQQAEKGWALTSVGGRDATIYCFRYEGSPPGSPAVSVDGTSR